tara:strand:+ start:385 stop:501 length:117 start_codon:yes stop_codon:yes gene_type:complete
MDESTIRDLLEIMEALEHDWIEFIAYELETLKIGETTS